MNNSSDIDLQDIIQLEREARRMRAEFAANLFKAGYARVASLFGAKPSNDAKLA